MADLDDKKVVNIGWLKEQGYTIKEAYTDNSWCPTYNNITAGTIGDNIGVSATCYGTGLEYAVTQLVCVKDVYPSGECTCPNEYGTATVTQTDSGLSVIPASGGSYTFSSDEVPYSAFTSTPTATGCSPCTYSSSAYTSFTTANITIPPNTTTESISIEDTNNHIHYVINQEAAGSCTCDNLTLSTSALSWSYDEITGSTSKTVTLTTDSCISDISVSSSDVSICTASVNDNTVTISPNNNIGEVDVIVSYKSNGNDCSKTIDCLFNEKECDCDSLTANPSYLEWTFADVTAHTSNTVTISTPSCITSTPTVTVKDTSLCTASFSSGTLTVTPTGTFGETIVEVNYAYGFSGSCSVIISCKFMNCSSPIDDIEIISEKVIDGGKVKLNFASIDSGTKALLFQENGSVIKIPKDGNVGLTPAETQAYSATTVSVYVVPGVEYIDGGTVAGRYMQTFSNFSKLESVILSDTVDTVGCFENCTSLRNIDFLNKVKVLGQSAFEGCTGLIGEIKISDNVKEVSYSVFEDCTNITKISFGEHSKLETFKPNDSTSFSPISGCTSLTTIVLPKSLTTLGRSACAGCPSLTTLIINRTTPPTLGEDAFRGSDNCIIYVPAASVATYKAASGWRTYASRIQAIP